MDYYIRPDGQEYYYGNSEGGRKSAAEIEVGLNAGRSIDTDLPIPVIPPEEYAKMPKRSIGEGFGALDNCYAYAFNIVTNPLKKINKEFPRKPAPGDFVYASENNGEFPEELTREWELTYFLGTDETNEALRELLIMDAEAIGAYMELPETDPDKAWEYIQNHSTEGMLGYFIVAVINPAGANDADKVPGYHFLREYNGFWTHKPGSEAVTSYEGEFIASNMGTFYRKSNDRIINPITAGARSGYTTFVGLFYYIPEPNNR